MKKHLQKLCFACVATIYCLGISQAQNALNINSDSKITESTKLRSIKSADTFNDAVRYRVFSYNTKLKSVKKQNVSDTLLLDFFEDKKYKAIIKNVSVSNDGITGISAQILDSDFAYCFISVSEKSISISADLPLLDEQYFVGSVNGKTYLSQYKMSVMQKKAIGCGTDNLDPIKTMPTLSTPPATKTNEESHSGDCCDHHGLSLRSVANNDLSCGDQVMDDPHEVRVLVVYTTAAKNWAAADWQVSDIDDLINQAFTRANTTLSNSLTGVTLNVVHKYETDYVEQNNNNDLSNIQGKNDGYMDNVHTLRSDYDADLVVFLANIDFTGGLGYLFNEWSEYGFNLNRVQQSSWTYTVIHEIGHNMGCSHDRDQLSSPGGNGTYSYSNGWHGYDGLGNDISTVMAYSDNYSDGVEYPNIPYFSSPDILYNGTPIGDAEYANNALTIKRNKRSVSLFEGAQSRISVTTYGYSKTYGDSDPSSYNPYYWDGSSADLVAGDSFKFIREAGEDVGVYSLTPKIFRNEDDVTCEYNAILTPGTLTINKRNVSASWSNQTTTYNGDNQYISSPTLNNAVAGNSIAFTYEYDKSGVVTDYALNAGVYSVKATTEGDANHNGTTTNATFTVNKAQATINLVEKTATYTGSAIGIDTPLTNPEAANINITYTGIDGTEYSESATEPIEVGKYRVKAVFAESDNYLGATEYTTLTIKIASSIDANESASKKVTVIPNRVKGGTTFIVQANSDNESLLNSYIEIYNLSGTLIEKIAVDNLKTKVTAPTTAGTYIVRFATNGTYSAETKLIVE